MNKKITLLEKQENRKNKQMYYNSLNQQLHLKSSNNTGSFSYRDTRSNSELPDINQHHRSHMIMPGLDHINSVGSKPLCRRGVSISPVKENLKIDYSLNEKLNTLRKSESRSSLRNSGTRNDELKKRYNSMNRNKTELIQSHNPITNPLNMYNPYSKNARMQVVNETNKLYKFS